MKKLFSLFLILCLALILVACGEKTPEATESSSKIHPTTQEETADTQTETSVPETTSAPVEMTYEQFVKKVEGVWIIDGTITPMPEEQCCFSLLVATEESCATAVYPGGIDRPGKFQDFQPMGESICQITLLFEGGMYMENIEEEHSSTLIFDFSVAGKLTTKTLDGYETHLTYGGSTFEEAHITACKLIQ